MAMYFYSGDITKPIPDGRGNVIAVAPRTSVEIIVETMPAKRLIAEHKLRRTGDVENVKFVDAISDGDVGAMERSRLALAVAEKGVTSGADIAPKKLSGTVEMTDGELGLAIAIDGSGVTATADAVSEGDKKSKRSKV